MRDNPTEPEKLLWRHLSNTQLGGLKFRRQSVIGTRIVDFFCPSIGLIVEVDGDTHDPDVDRARDYAARAIGFATLRVTNAEVMANIDGVLEAILKMSMGLEQRTAWRLPHPNPSPEGEGLRK
ncbi:MAG: hypothetical protein C0476_04180 [Sphingomonas sp.]|nr:hypothetical protein [Sphingomonas sp.]